MLQLGFCRRQTQAESGVFYLTVVLAALPPPVPQGHSLHPYLVFSVKITRIAHAARRFSLEEVKGRM